MATQLLAAALVSSVAVAAPGCNGSSSSQRNERWVTTENTNVDIDWDAVGKAYREAEGPEDLERRINEIYEGDEIISVAVRDLDDKSQEVTGFFDKNSSGSVDDGEKIFTINRKITAEDKGNYQIQGYGHYSHYRSPLWDIGTGMLMGAMISRAFSPGYTPMYRQGYVTAPARRTALASQRSTYRQANPDKFRKGQKSRSGRQYNRQGSRFGGGKPTPSTRPRTRSMPRGGGRFGARRPAGRRVVRLG